ncbi:hypothetical protein [Paraburkholderia fungorum]|uniref:hypothetical protein n=1 Tax=Paraburkholderia fungorum TaxID=134537 RepID=UPI00217F0A62|nr:hypothetical protein [Paraburkholderia fungorum]
MREFAQADYRIHLQQRVGDLHGRFLAWGKRVHPIGQALMVLEQLLGRLNRFRARRADEIEAFGKNRGGAAGNDGLGKRGRVGQLSIEVDVSVDQPWNGIKTFTVENLTHLDSCFVGIQRDDALIVNENGPLIDGFAVDVEDIQILQQEIGFLFPVEHIEDRSHVVVLGSHLVTVSGCCDVSLADFLIHGLSLFHQLV